MHGLVPQAERERAKGAPLLRAFGGAHIRAAVALAHTRCPAIHMSAAEPYQKWSTCRQALKEFLNRMVNGGGAEMSAPAPVLQ